MSQTPPKDWLFPGYSHVTMRKWQREAVLTKSNLVYPIFVCDEPNVKAPIPSLPEQYRWSVNRLSELIDPLVKKGLSSVIIFGVLTDESDKQKSLQFLRDETGSIALSSISPVVLALQYLRKKYPNLLLIADLCLCAYTSHGHCGLLDQHGFIDNAKSIERVAEVAVHYAQAGAHIIAPSCMLDGKIYMIRKKLYENQLASRCAVMSYAVKYHSALFGPFREANKSDIKSTSAPNELMNDRSMYQLPVASRGLGVRAAIRCKKEGADFIIIKPGMLYLDIIRDTKARLPDTPLAVYQVSGEYTMFWYAAQANAINLKDTVLESCISFRRAGATIIISYFTPRLLDWLDENQSKL